MKLNLGEPDPQKIEEALASFRRFGAVLDQRLEGKQYVVGDALTLADLTLASSLMYAMLPLVVCRVGGVVALCRWAPLADRE
jgi:glutathione S-transferase